VDPIPAPTGKLPVPKSFKPYAVSSDRPVPQDKIVTRPGPSAAQVVSPHLAAGSAAAYSLGATVAAPSVHAGARATTAAPNSGSSQASPLTSPTVPGTPQSLSVNLTPVQAIITWTAPASNGGAPIDMYVVNSYVYKSGTWQYLNSVESCGACTTADVVSLQPDMSYAFYLYAHNSQGFGYPASDGGLLNDAASDCYPSMPQAVPGNGTMTVSWAAPYASAAYAQGPLEYAVLLVPWQSGAELGPYDTTGLSMTISGLANGTTYGAVVEAYFPNLYDCENNSGYATVGTPPPDALMGAGSRSFFSYDSYHVSDQITAQVNIGSGDLLVTQNDVSLPGAAGSYSVGQEFNSLALSPSASLNTDGGGTGELYGRQVPNLSPGWRFNTGNDVFLAIGNGVVTYYDRSGGAWSFTQSGQAWNPPPGLNVTMKQNQTTGQWTVLDHQSNDTLTFDASGTLISDVDRNANPVVFSTDNPDSSYNHQYAPSVRVTGSAGYTPPNSVLIDPYGGGTNGTSVSSISQVPGDGTAAHTTTFGYNSANQLSSVTDAAGETTSYGYDSAGNIELIVSPGGRYTYFFYDSNHRVNYVYQYTGNTWAVTTYNYATAGHTLVTDPDGHPPINYTIDTNYRVTNTVDAAGATTSTVWNGNSNVGSATNQLQGTTTNTYGANPGPNGNESLTQTQDPTGTINQGSYGNGSGCQTNNPPAAAYLPATLTAPVTGATKNCYDSLGNLTSTTDPANNMTSITYAADGTPATSTTPANQASGVHTVYYETYGHQVDYATPSNGVGPSQVTAFDVWGNSTTVESLPSDNTQTTTFDNMHRPLQITYSGTPANTVSYTYDADGNLTKQVDNSGTTTRGYDGMERLTSLVAPNGVNDTYGYDTASNLTSLINGAGTTSYHYNTLNEVDQVTEPSGRIDILGYNAMAEQTNLWTNTGSQVTYNGTTVIAPTSFATHTVSAYDAADQILIRGTALASNNNNLFSDIVYNRVTTSSCPGTPANVTTSQIQSEYDYVHNVTNTLCYNSAGRLASATVNNVATSYTYNADGAPISGSLGSFTYNSVDQITNSGYTYDGDADLTATPTMTATYNSADQTNAITPSGSSATTFGYIGTGQATRSSVSASGVTTTFANGLLGIESQTAASSTTSFVTLPDGTPIEEVTPTGAYYYVTDNQGSIIGLIDTSGTAHASYTYTPYGVQTAAALNGTLPSNPLGFDGGYVDSSTGLIHFGARYYSPALGQWTQLDPSGRSLAYTFANDDPINFEDTSGLKAPSLSDYLEACGSGAATKVVFGAITGADYTGVGALAAAIEGCGEEVALTLLESHNKKLAQAVAVVLGSKEAYEALERGAEFLKDYLELD
jgi:RHS repeat-associated protein